jgi:hypothetical protein
VRAALVLAVLHGLALVACAFLPLPAAVIAVVGVGISGIKSAVALIALPHRPVQTWLLGDDGTLRGLTASGEGATFEVLGARVLAAWLVVVGVRSTGAAGRRRHWLLLVGGDQGDSALREWRIWLKWRGAPARIGAPSENC